MSAIEDRYIPTGLTLPEPAPLQDREAASWSMAVAGPFIAKQLGTDAPEYATSVIHQCIYAVGARIHVWTHTKGIVLTSPEKKAAVVLTEKALTLYNGSTTTALEVDQSPLCLAVQALHQESPSWPYYAIGAMAFSKGSYSYGSTKMTLGRSQHAQYGRGVLLRVGRRRAIVYEDRAWVYLNPLPKSPGDHFPAFLNHALAWTHRFGLPAEDCVDSSGSYVPANTWQPNDEEEAALVLRERVPTLSMQCALQVVREKEEDFHVHRTDGALFIADGMLGGEPLDEGVSLTCWAATRVDPQGRKPPEEWVCKVVREGSTRLADEQKALKGLNHPNIVDCPSVVKDPFIYFEPRLTPLQLWAINRPISDICRLFVGLAQALIYLGKNGVVHRDVKVNNLFVDDKGHLKLGDFESAGSVTTTWPEKHPVGGVLFCAPETYSRQYPFSNDLYGAGISLWYSVGLPIDLRGSLINNLRDGRKSFEHLITGLRIPADLHPLADMLRPLFTREAAERPTVQKFASNLQDLLNAGLIPSRPTVQEFEIFTDRMWLSGSCRSI